MNMIFKKFPAAALIDGEWVTSAKTFSVTDPATGAEVATVPGSARAYKAAGLEFNTTYTFRIRAINSGGASDYSNTAEVTTPTFGVHVNFAAGTGNSAGKRSSRRRPRSSRP